MNNKYNRFEFLRTRKNLSVVVALLVLTAACSGDSLLDEGSHEITFSVQMAGQTKANVGQPGQFGVSSLVSLDQFSVTGYDNSELIIARETPVLKSKDGLWRLEENPKVWQQDHTMTFWASANMPSWAEVSQVSLESATMTVTSSIPESVSEQWDPLIGYYNGVGEDGHATIMFYHPMTAVSFRTGTKGDPEYIASISSVTLKGIYATGSAAVSSSASGELEFSWTGDGSTSASGGFNTDGTQSDKPFLLIPQTISGGNIGLDISVALKAGGNKVIDNVTIPAGEWLPGIHYTYTLDYSKTIPMEIKVELTDWEPLKNKNDEDYFKVLFR